MPINEGDKKLTLLTSKLNYEKEKLNSINSELNVHLEKIEMLKNHQYDPDCKYCRDNKFVKAAEQAKIMIPKFKSNIESF